MYQYVDLERWGVNLWPWLLQGFPASRPCQPLGLPWPSGSGLVLLCGLHLFPMMPPTLPITPILIRSVSAVPILSHRPCLLPGMPTTVHSRTRTGALSTAPHMHACLQEKHTTRQPSSIIPHLVLEFYLRTQFEVNLTVDIL